MLYNRVLNGHFLDSQKFEPRTEQSFLVKADV